jgi:hypothetical protein
MPNWCSNKLTITGNKENLAVFKDQVKGKRTDLCLNNLVPMPKELEGTTSPGDDPNWYEWRLRNWGIKWNIEAHLVDESENMLIYEFESPWCPPYGWIGKIAPMFPDLSFELYYKEPGMCFQGTIVAQKDLFIDQEEDYYEEMDEFDEELEEICEDDQEFISITKRE